jgi:hypothetical protein
MMLGRVRHVESDVHLGVETHLIRGPEVCGGIEIEPIGTPLQGDVAARIIHRSKATVRIGPTVRAAVPPLRSELQQDDANISGRTPQGRIEHVSGQAHWLPAVV